MSAVVEVIEDVGRGIGNFIGDVVETVGDVIEGVVDVAGDILQGVGNVVGKVVESALDDPLGSIAKVAAIATGQFHLLPVISATSVVANGGSFEDALKAGAIGYVTQGVAQYVGGGAFDANADFVAYDAQQLAAQGFGREQIADILGASGVNATAAAAAATAASEGLGQANVLEAIRLSTDSANPIFVDATTQAAQANGGITDLVDNGFTSEVQRTLADQGISLQDQIDLAKQGTNAADVSVMAENGFSSEIQKTLADQGISIQDQIDLAKQGATAGDAQVMAENGFTSEIQKTLTDQGISIQDQVDLVKQGATAVDAQAMAENGFTGQVQKAFSEQGVSIQDQIDLARTGTTASQTQGMIYTAEGEGLSVADIGKEIRTISEITGVSPTEALTLKGYGYDANVLQDLRDSGFTVDQINRAVDLNLGPDALSRYTQQGYTPDQILEAGQDLNFSEFVTTAPAGASIGESQPFLDRGYSQAQIDAAYDPNGGWGGKLLQQTPGAPVAPVAPVMDSGMAAAQARTGWTDLQPRTFADGKTVYYSPSAYGGDGGTVSFDATGTPQLQAFSGDPVASGAQAGTVYSDPNAVVSAPPAPVAPEISTPGVSAPVEPTPVAPPPAAPVQTLPSNIPNALRGMRDVVPYQMPDGTVMYQTSYGVYSAEGTLQHPNPDWVNWRGGSILPPEAPVVAPPAPVIAPVAPPVTETVAAAPGPIAPPVSTTPPLTELNAAQTEELMRNVDPGMVNNLAPVKSGTAGGTISSLLSGDSLNPITNIVKNLGVTDPTIIGALTGAGTSVGMNLLTGQPITGQSILQGALGGGVAGTIGANLPDMGGGTIGSALAGAATNVGATVVVNAVTGQPITGATLAGAALTGGVIGAAVPMVTDGLGNTTYQYDDGSSMTVNRGGTPVAVTDSSGVNVPVAGVDTRTGEPKKLVPVEDAVPSPVDRTGTTTVSDTGVSPVNPDSPYNISSNGQQGDTPGQVLLGADGEQYLTLDSGKVVKLSEYQAAIDSGKPISIDGQITTAGPDLRNMVPRSIENPGTGELPANTELASLNERDGATWNDQLDTYVNPTSGAYYDQTTGAWVRPIAVAPIDTTGIDAGPIIPGPVAGPPSLTPPPVVIPAPVPGDFDSGPSIPGVPVTPVVTAPPVNQPYNPYTDQGPSQPGVVTPGPSGPSGDTVTDLGEVPIVDTRPRPVTPDPVYVPEIEIVAPRPVTPPPMPSPDDDFPPTPPPMPSPDDDFPPTPEPPMPSPDEDFPPTPEPTPEPTPVTPPVYPPIYVPQPPVVTPPPLAPLPPLNWGDVGRVNLPGTNPGWFTNVPEQYAPQGIRSQYYWGQHPYQTGERFSPEQYRQVPAPVAPWGLQQMYTPQTIEDLLRGVGQAATKPSAPRV